MRSFLLALDFDSAVTRQNLFAHNPAFCCKLAIIHRIVWFYGGPSEPSSHHAWFHFDRQHQGQPTLRYVINRQPRRLAKSRGVKDATMRSAAAALELTR
jgi:hypothetical protein